jgi:hypothetical protein
MEQEREARSSVQGQQDSSIPHYQREQISKETGNRDVMEEYAAEISVPYTAPSVPRVVRTQEVEKPKEVSETVETEKATPRAYPWLGIAALTMAVLSMFMYPTLFGSGAALLGFFAFLAGNRALGVWSIILGLIALAGYFLLVPLYA